MPDYERGYEREEYITSRPRASVRYEPIEETYVEHRKSTERRRPTTPYYEEERYERYETEPERDRSTSSSTSNRQKSVDIKTIEKSKIKPCGPLCKDHPNHKSKAVEQESDSDYDSEEYEQKKRTARKKKLIAAAAATVTTLAAVNGAINHTKAARSRRQALADGEICSSEYELQKTKSRARDVFSIAVVAVGLNNVHNAWKKHHAERQEHMKQVMKHEEKRKKKLEKAYSADDDDIEEVDFRRVERVERKLVGGGGSNDGRGGRGKRELQETAYEETYRERESWAARDKSRDTRDRSRDTRYER